jgi:predicted dienelactone hydrolase
MNRRFLLTTVFLLAACASSPQEGPEPAVKPTPGYGADAGPQAVGVIPDASVHDARRNKDLPVAIDYPIYGGPYPVIVFSHGYGGSKNGYEPLVSYWTSFGYVVIRPSHADANALRDVFESARTEAAGTAGGGGGRAGRGQRPATAGIVAVARSIEDIWTKEREPQWRDRALDISLVIDSLGDLETRFPELRGKIDHDKVGVGGHSYGAFTALLVAGMKTFSNPPLSLKDPRVKAVVAMSPQGVSPNRGITPESFRDITIPVLYMTGSQDFGAAKNEDPAWRRTAFENSPPGDKYFVEIEGATHLSFTGRLGMVEGAPRTFNEPRDPLYPGRTGGLADTRSARRPNVMYGGGRNILRIIRDISLAFWDGYLKSDPKGKEFLQTKAASDAVKVERK